MEPMAKIQLPSEEEIILYKVIIKHKVKYLGEESVALTGDSNKIYIQVSPNDKIQEMFYNGWQHNHYISCVFVLSPEGKNCIMVINAPGCMHNSLVDDYGVIYKKLDFC